MYKFMFKCQDKTQGCIKHILIHATNKNEAIYKFNDTFPNWYETMWTIANIDYEIYDGQRMIDTQ